MSVSVSPAVSVSKDKPKVSSNSRNTSSGRSGGSSKQQRKGGVPKLNHSGSMVSDRVSRIEAAVASKRVN